MAQNKNKVSDMVRKTDDLYIENWQWGGKVL
jgi:hypothetical protein